MDSTVPRSQPSNIIAACIVAAGLVAAALIVAHRPPAVAVSAAPDGTAALARPLVMPPITQASAQEQFRTQVLAAPTVHTLLYKGVTYTLTDVKVSQVIYTIKNDDFTILFDWDWQPAMPAGGPQHDSASLSNDGYGHYYGAAVLSPIIGGSGQNVDITIR